VDGISLTINQVKDDKISLCIIPHTQEKTTLTAQKVGAKVNLEADILLKYIEKISSSRRSLRSK
jgi:riboflavin synthase